MDSVDCQAPLSMGLSWQEYWIGLPFPSPRDLFEQVIQPVPPAAPVLAGGFLPLSYLKLEISHCNIDFTMVDCKGKKNKQTWWLILIIILICLCPCWLYPKQVQDWSSWLTLANRFFSFFSKCNISTNWKITSIMLFPFLDSYHTKENIYRLNRKIWKAYGNKPTANN